MPAASSLERLGHFRRAARRSSVGPMSWTDTTGGLVTPGLRVPTNVRALPYGLAVCALLVTALGGCAGAKYDGQMFKNDEVAFRIGPPPPSWRAIETDEALIAFRDDSGQATVAVGARCGRDGDDVPLRALTQHLFLQFTDRTEESERTFTLDGREALETDLFAKLDGVPQRYSVVVLKKDGCVYDFVRIANPATGDAGRAEFRRFVESFRTVGEGAE